MVQQPEQMQFQFEIISLKKQRVVSCPVGLSGLCCHILGLLLCLKDYTNISEKILELTCTEDCNFDLASQIIQQNTLELF